MQSLSVKRCVRRGFFFLISILGTQTKIDEISIFVLYHLKCMPGSHFYLGEKIAVAFAKCDASVS